MWIDPIVEEILPAREDYAAQFNYDLKAICRDIRAQERLSGRELVTLPPKRPEQSYVPEEQPKAA